MSGRNLSIRLESILSESDILSSRIMDKTLDIGLVFMVQN